MNRATELSSIRTMSMRGIALLFAVLLIFLTLGAWVSDESNEAARWVAHTQEVEKILGTVLSTLQDAETGQRGYLLTSNESYLAPYHSASAEISSTILQLQNITSDNAFQQERVSRLKTLASDKLEELGETVQLHRRGEKKQALAIVKSDKGKQIMDRIRVVIDTMQSHEAELLQDRNVYFAQITQASLLTEIIGFLLFFGVSFTVLIQIGRALYSRQVAESKLVESEARTRLILNSAGQGIYGLNLDGKTTFVNRKVSELLGYSAEELLGQDMHSLVGHTRSDGSNYPRTESAILNALEADTVAEITDEVLIRKDGSTFTVDYVSTPIYWNGEKTGAVVVFSDTTERGRLEEQLRRSQKLEAIGQLSGGIAHDFNNLLGVVLGNAEMVEFQLDSGGDPREFTDGIVQAVEKAASLTQRLLAFSRQQPLAASPTDISATLRSMEEMLKRTLGTTVDLTINYLEQVALVLIDNNQFENAVLNLALNARDAMPSGGSLTIETNLITLDDNQTENDGGQKSGEYIEVAFTDTGSGMTAETLQKVFEPFFTTKGIGKGSGLGLSMVYGFVKQSGGSIEVLSEPDLGTTVKLHLPRSFEPADTPSATDGDRRLCGGTGRILVVEDEPHLRDISVDILIAAGYDVVEAEDGAAAVNHLEMGPRFDLVFTDLALPGGMTGQDIAQKAKEIQNDIKVLYTTGFAENTLFNNQKLDPSISLLQKPFRRKDLLDRVMAILSEDDSGKLAFGIKKN